MRHFSPCRRQQQPELYVAQFKMIIVADIVNSFSPLIIITFNLTRLHYFHALLDPFPITN